MEDNQDYLQQLWFLITIDQSHFFFYFNVIRFWFPLVFNQVLVNYTFVIFAWTIGLNHFLGCLQPIISVVQFVNLCTLVIVDCPLYGWPTSLTPTVQSNLLTNYFFDFINYFYHAHLFRGCLRRISFLTDPSTSSTIWLIVLLVDNCFDSTRLYSLFID